MGFGPEGPTPSWYADEMKLPKLRMRRLLVVVLLIAAYFGAWEATKREAERRESRLVTTGRHQLDKFTSPASFIIQDRCLFYIEDEVHVANVGYEFWLFGLVKWVIVEPAGLTAGKLRAPPAFYANAATVAAMRMMPRDSRNSARRRANETEPQRSKPCSRVRAESGPRGSFGHRSTSDLALLFIGVVSSD